MTDYAKEVAKASLKTEAIKLYPSKPVKWASGYPMPIYNNNRLLLGQHRELVADGFIDVINKNNISFDLIAGTSTAGIAPAATLAQKIGTPVIICEGDKFYEFNTEMIPEIDVNSDMIASTVPFSIIPGVMLANNLSKPFVYARPAKKDHGLEKQVEGPALGKTAVLIDYFMKNSYAEEAIKALKSEEGIEVIKTFSKNLEAFLKPVSVSGKNVLVIEDLVSTGGSSAKEAKQYIDAGAKVENLLCIFNYGLDKANEEFNNLKLKCNVKSILTYQTLLNELKESKYFNDAEIELLKDWRADPFNWWRKNYKQAFTENDLKAKERACLALDFRAEKDQDLPNSVIVKKALDLVSELSEYIGMYKVGKQLHSAAEAEGVNIINEIYKRGGKIFLDLKGHDTDDTIEGFIRANIVPGVEIINIHGGEIGEEAIIKAVKVAKETAYARKLQTPKIIGVTVLTTLNDEKLRNEDIGSLSNIISDVKNSWKEGITLEEVGDVIEKYWRNGITKENIQDIIKNSWRNGTTLNGIENTIMNSKAYESLVKKRTELAIKCGLDGIVCPANKAGMLEKTYGNKLLYVTPGIEYGGVAGAGQKQLYTPDLAVKDCSNSILVLGSAITKAKNKEVTAYDIIKLMGANIK